ncbi:88b10f2d-a6eb-4c17-b30c-dddcbccc18d9, partial [Cladorrhinum sp. PSN332]
KSSYTESRIEIDSRHRPHTTALDLAESEYRARIQSNYKSESSTTVNASSYRPSTVKKPSSHGDLTVDFPAPRPSSYNTSSHVDDLTVDYPAPRKTVIRKDLKLIEETVEPRRYTPSTVSTTSKTSKAEMGYYDEDGHYHSYRQDLSNKVHKKVQKIADSIPHYEAHASVEATSSGAVAPKPTANNVTIPCHHIRLGDILILQGRPCQVIRISTSAATGQHRYLGVDLFTKQLHEESSFVSNPAPSVVVQTMLGPVFKQYRVLDIQEGTIVAMTESGDVKQNLSVIDQSNLWSRLQKAFESGRGSVRVLVVTDNGREMAVDMKVVHGSRL